MTSTLSDAARAVDSRQPPRSYLVESGGILLADATRPVAVDVPESETPAVRLAARALAGDLTAVTGCRAWVAAGADQGTPSSRIRIASLDAAPGPCLPGDLRLDRLRDEQGEDLWEGYLLQTVGEDLWIVGTSRRGTIFGIYDLSRAIGVSPWHWFADVPVRRRAQIRVARGVLRSDHPSVRYRGIFINDEEELDAWARAHTGDGTIGPELYARVFELLLRLGGNYIWPAMHVNSFNSDPENGRLAEEMGVVVGTSHCDILMRSNQNEWAPWLASVGEHVEYDYSLPGRNRELLRQYWRDSVRQNKDYEVSWTLGVRGIHDTGFVTAAIDADDSLSAEQRTQAKTALLGQAIADQRELLRDELPAAGGAPDGRRPLTTFIPYKEVLPLYDAGLAVPEDTTIIWSDDNFGHLRRLPSERERRRPGGHGLYFHSSYWSQPPRSYLFLSSTPLAQMRAVLRAAWGGGIRTLWIDNVGAIKPLEQDIEYFLDCAWQAGRETTTADPCTWTEQWIDRQFSGGIGAAAARLLQDWALVANMRKVEHLSSRSFSQTSFGDGAIRRVARLRAIDEGVAELLGRLPPEEHDAFWQLVAFKVRAAWLTNAEFYYADRSLLAHDQGKMRAADHWLAVSREFSADRRELISWYNTAMAHGKWNGVLTPESFPPPTTALYPAARPALRIEASSRLDAVVWGAEQPIGSGGPARLEFAADRLERKWIEVFPTGAAGLDFEVRSDDWIHVGPASGRVDVERRLDVRIDAGCGGRQGTITVREAAPGGGAPPGSSLRVEVAVAPAPRAGIDPDARLESDSVVSIETGRPDEQVDGDGARWTLVPALGRYGGDLLQVERPASGHPAADADRSILARAARVGYRIHLSTPGAHVVQIHRFPTLDSTGKIRLGVGVDGLEPVVVESATTDEYRGAWTRMVMENVERLHVRLPWLDAGDHTVWLLAIDPGVAVSALVVHTGPVDAGAALVPRFSHTTRETRPWSADPDPERESAPRLPGSEGRADAPLPPVAYAPEDFWATDTTFKRPLIRAQRRLGPRRHRPAEDGSTDVLAGFARGPVRESEPGILAIEVERALVGDADGWTTDSLDAPAIGWRHTQSETDGGTGLALHVDARGRTWADPADAPGAHVRVAVGQGGTYHAWALVKYDDRTDDALWLSVDGTPQPASEQSCGGHLYTFGTQQVWVWAHISRVELAAGPHVLSVLARSSGLRVDRLYLTLDGHAMPPVDAQWPGALESPGTGED